MSINHVSALNYQVLQWGTTSKRTTEETETAELAGSDLNSSRLPYLRPWGLLDETSSRELFFSDQAVDPSEESGNPGCWWLLHTKSRQEKMVAEQLCTRRVPHFLPVVQKTSLSRGRTRTATLPLFTGYLFLWGNDRSRLHALQTNRVCKITRVTEGEQLRSDLRQIAKLISLGIPLTAEARLATGQRFRVKSGKFVDFEGTVIKRSDKTHLFVAVEYMQTGVSMKIEDYLLEPI
jgi:transcriptional antiterminator NusG